MSARIARTVNKNGLRIEMQKSGRSAMLKRAADGFGEQLHESLTQVGN